MKVLTESLTEDGVLFAISRAVFPDESSSVVKIKAWDLVAPDRLAADTLMDNYSISAHLTTEDEWTATYPGSDEPIYGYTKDDAVRRAVLKALGHHEFDVPDELAPPPRPPRRSLFR